MFNKEGTKPDPKNVISLQEASRPTSKAELRSFLGMAGFSERFIPNFASIAHPLRCLLKATRWEWNETCHAAFEEIKSSLSEYSLLYHYVIGQDTELVGDASVMGLGSILVKGHLKLNPFGQLCISCED